VITIVRLGWATTIQDRGRSGLAHLGVPRSGAIDVGLAAVVNRAVGNPMDHAVLETAGGLVVEARREVLVATSAHLAPVHLRPGERVAVDPAHDRAWAYLAVRGGLVADAVLGSRSQDTLSGLGPPRLAEGATLEVADAPAAAAAADVVAIGEPGHDVRVWPGPRTDWFEPGALQRLCAVTWSVGTEVSRVGMRLDGPALRRAVQGELPSEGLVRGAVQVTPDGRPVVMLADHPTTGGYPVLAVVHPDDVGDLAQHRPGRAVRFRRVGGDRRDPP
jgi:biotin-dependent carboxylase-like uncharacterized protein